MSPGEITLGQGDIETFPKRKRVTIKVKNTGDRPIQVGSHFHFFEANRASLRVTVPKMNEAAAPSPAATPMLIPLGCLIIRNRVERNIATEAIGR